MKYKKWSKNTLKKVKLDGFINFKHLISEYSWKLRIIRFENRENIPTKELMTLTILPFNSQPRIDFNFLLFILLCQTLIKSSPSPTRSIPFPVTKSMQVKWSDPHEGKNHSQNHKYSPIKEWAKRVFDTQQDQKSRPAFAFSRVFVKARTCSMFQRHWGINHSHQTTIIPNLSDPFSNLQTQQLLSHLTSTNFY